MHLERHDDEAVARDMVRNLNERGENEAADTWLPRLPIIVAIEVWLAGRRDDGELVIEALAPLDQMAFVRSASVYRNFREAKDFGEFVGQIMADDD